MTNAYIVTGTLTDAKTVQLDEPLPAGGGKVRVIVEMVAPAVPAESLREFLDRIHRRRAEAGIPPLTPEQIEEWVADVRFGRGH